MAQWSLHPAVRHNPAILINGLQSPGKYDLNYDRQIESWLMSAVAVFDYLNNPTMASFVTPKLRSDMDAVIGALKKHRALGNDL